MGVGDARLFLGLRAPERSARKTSTFTASRPVARSKASARSESPTAVVIQTRPPATTGEDHPVPGTGVFQTTFRDSLQSSGRPRSVECP